MENDYAISEESLGVVPLRQRLRRPLALSASALLVASAVYVGFIHRSEVGVTTPIGVSGKVQTQLAQQTQSPRQTQQPQQPQRTRNARPPSAAIAQRPATTVAAIPHPAPMSTPPVPQLAVPPPPATRLAKTMPDNRRDVRTASNAPQKPRPDISRHLKAARADLARNNLSATKARLAAAFAVQPNNRDALSLRTTVNTREQQRDALLSLARGCGYVARWGCVSHNASTALSIDSSSKEAQRLVMLASHESALASLPPPIVEPPPQSDADLRDLMAHH